MYIIYIEEQAILDLLRGIFLTLLCLDIYIEIRAGGQAFGTGREYKGQCVVVKVDIWKFCGVCISFLATNVMSRIPKPTPIFLRKS